MLGIPVFQVGEEVKRAVLISKVLSIYSYQ